jgi:hypothetical protein
MKQVLLYKTTQNGPVYFFVREYVARHADVEVAHKDSMLYKQSKFKKAIALNPEFELMASIAYDNLPRYELIAGYEALNFKCLNVQRNRK